MKRRFALIFLCLIWSAAQASAEVMHYSKCQLAEGKTMADVQAWVDDWRVLSKANGIDYRIRLLVPHADNDLGADEFFLEGGSSTLQSHAAAWDWWYTSDEAAKSATQLNAAASCASGAIYRSTD
ncbi:MAG: hypothetical protein JRH01_18260 [Deltaproteobacteria bacterium]|nr:hypothetical protein [Deltaproteobacteria bacterium]MBW2397193.1 hypothetical protein [Deltaproteobacteria bacterium]